jgi:hypothetical protein
LIELKIELEPEAPLEDVPDVAPAPPAPTVTLYATLVDKESIDSADAPPPEVPADVLKPPAPPPPPWSYPPAPPPATTRKSAVTAEPLVHPKAAKAAAPILDNLGIFMQT